MANTKKKKTTATKPALKLSVAQKNALTGITQGYTHVDGRTLNALRAKKLVKGTKTLALTAAGVKALQAAA